MKKLLLTLGLVAGAMMANATVYTVYEAGNGIDWTGDGNTLTYENEGFDITYSKGTSTSNLVKPNTEWRMYKNSIVTIESSSVTMKGIRFTCTANNYAKEVTINTTGWTGVLDGTIYTFTNNAGANTFEIKMTEAQIRVSKVEISDQPFGDAPEPEPATEVNSIKETIAQSNGQAILINYPMTVAFVNHSNIFACDAAGDFIQIYGANQYEVNDIIPAGWEGTYKLYSGTTPEIEPTTLPEASGKGNFVPKYVAAADITTALVNNVIAIKDVVFEEETPSTKANFTGISNGTELNFRNNYEYEGVDAGTYNVVVLVIIYNNAPSLYILNYDADTVTGVAEIAVENGQEAYYTLQGVRVSTPENGLYIRVKDGKASKVIIR